MKTVPCSLNGYKQCPVHLTHTLSRSQGTGFLYRFVRNLKYPDLLLFAAPGLLNCRCVACRKPTDFGYTAEYLYKKLLLLGKQVILATTLDSIGVLENNLKNIGAFVAISKSGETQSVIDKLLKAKNAGIFTVAFTKETPNRLGACSDLNFKVTDQHKLDDRNLLPNTFFPFTRLLVEYLLSRYLKEINEVDEPKE